MYIELAIPTLAPRPTSFNAFWMRQIFIGNPEVPYPIQGVASSFLRHTDAARTYYELGSEAVVRFWEESINVKLGEAAKAASHFENCLGSIQVALRCFRKLRSNASPPSIRGALRARKADFAKAPFSEQVRKIRDAVHHVEEKLLAPEGDGIFEIGTPFAIDITGPEIPHPTVEGNTLKTVDRLRLGNRSITLAEIATAIGEMSDMVELINVAFLAAEKAH